MLVFSSRHSIGELRSLAGKSWIIMSTNQVPLEKNFKSLTHQVVYLTDLI